MAETLNDSLVKVTEELKEANERSLQASKELGKDFIVMTDANQGYGFDVGIRAAQAFAEQAGVARGVVRRAERPARDERLPRLKQAHDAVNLGRRQRLVERQQPAIDGGHDLGLAAHDPARRARRWQAI